MQEFPKPSPGLLKLLAETGDTPGYTPPAPAPPVPAPQPPPEDAKKRKLESSEDHRQAKKVSVTLKEKSGPENPVKWTV